MDTFQTIKPEEFHDNPFELIGKQWMLITAEKEGKVNTMTASWGGLGIMWAKNVVFIMVRKSRYTKEMIDGSDSFSLTFLDHQKYGKELGYLGSVSGRDEDKIEKSKLTIERRDGVPFFQEGSKVFICKKLSCQPLTPDNFTMPGIDEQFYNTKDYHDLYIGEIVEILVK